MKKLIKLFVLICIFSSCKKEVDYTSYLSPVSAFTYTISTLDYKKVQFQNASHSTTSQTKYFWTFGDTGTSVKENPVYTYLSEGDYNVVMKVTNGKVSDCSYQTIHISSVFIDSLAHDPLVSFVYSQNSRYIYFQNTSSYTNTKTKYFWTFGNGDTSKLENPNYVYSRDGMYNVVLKVTSNEKSFSYSKPIIISSSPNPSYDTVRPMPSFQYFYDGNVVHFVNSSSFTTASTKYYWYFGDGQEMDDENPMHTYANGDYTVVFKVSNAVYTVSCTQNIHVPFEQTINYDPSMKPLAKFVFSQQARIIYFQNASSNTTPRSTYAWTFGDGNVSFDENPYYPYTKAGNYKVVLKVTNESLSDSYTLDVTIP
jgi:PKD repeat protein